MTHEIDLLRRASEHEPKHGPAAAFWKELCETFHLRVIVDIVAGTSAGGLNGALLASAAAAGVPLPRQLRELWVAEAALSEDRLLKTEDPPESLLSGTFMQDKIKQVTGEIRPGDAKTGHHPVTLFLTATGLGGKESIGTDSQGQKFAYEDHRRLYRFAFDPQRFRYQAGRGLEADPENDFNAQGHEALAVAARASASFPLAFAPVSEQRLLAGTGYRVQPKASSRQQPATYLMDGGVLDNAPFGPVLAEMRRRPVTGPYRRILAYVVPSSGLPSPAPDGAGAADVSPAGAQTIESSPRWTTVLSRAINMPREADFRGDVDELDQTLSVAAESAIRRLYRRMRMDSGDREGLLGTAMSLRGEYRRARAVGGVWQMRYALGHGPLRVTLSVPATVDADRLLEAAACRWVPPADVGFGLPPLGFWPWGLSAAEQVLLMLLRDTQEALNAPQTLMAAAPVKLALIGVNALAQELSTALAHVGAVKTAVEADIARRGQELKDGARIDDAALADLIDEIFTELAVEPALSTIVRQALRAYAAAALQAERGEARDPISDAAIEERASEVLSWTLTAEVLSRAFATPSLAEPVAPIEFARMGPDVMSPYQPLSEIDGERKLFGTRLGHFGGFGASDARARDWQWGRLDGAAHLTRLLLPKDLSEDEVRNWISRAQQAVLADEANVQDEPATLAHALVAATKEAAGKSDSELFTTLLQAKVDGTTMASSLGKSGVHLLTRARIARQTQPRQVGWQVAIEAAIGRQPLSRAAGKKAVIRWLATDLRRALWQALHEGPASLSSRLAAAAKRWAMRTLALAVIAGALLAASITALAYGDRRTAAISAVVLVACAALLALRIWVFRPRD